METQRVCACVCVLESLKEQTFTMYIKLHGAVTSHSMNNTESGVSRNLVEASVNHCHSAALQVPAGLRLPPVASSHRLLPEPEMKMEMKTKEGMKPILSFLFSLSSPAQSLSRHSLSLASDLLLSLVYAAACLFHRQLLESQYKSLSIFMCLSITLFRLTALWYSLANIQAKASHMEQSKNFPFTYKHKQTLQPLLQPLQASVLELI